MILIVSEEGDLHALAVRKILERDHQVDCRVLVMSDFPERMKGSYSVSQSGCHSWLVARDETLDTATITGVLWRRPTPTRPPRVFAESSPPDALQAECDHFLQGLLWSLDVAWINHPMANLRASRKLIQLTTARNVGLVVPLTTITNDPEDARRFVRQAGTRRLICKRVGTSPGVLTKTFFVTPDVAERLDSLELCPAILQEYVDGPRDVRVVYVDGQCFAVAIDAASGTCPEDSRFDLTVEFHDHRLPREVHERLTRFMTELGLRFGVIDFKLGSDGLYYFFEVNPAGQFAYLQLKTGAPMTEALAAALVRRDGPHPGEVRG